MSFEVIVSNRFQRKLKRLAKKYLSIKHDFASLLDVLELNPITGSPLGRDCYKVRMAITAKSKGKSGGARIITCVKIVGQAVYLLDMYDKSEQSSISIMSGTVCSEKTDYYKTEKPAGILRWASLSY